jgi:hypothetical protein
VPSGGKGKQTTKPVDQGTKKPLQRKKPTRRGSDASDPALDSPPDHGRAAIMPKGGNSLSLLPAVLSSLKGKYLATLYCALYASEEPFDHFVKTSPRFLEVSRQAFEKVWPHLKITVETDDALFNVVSLSAMAIKHGLYPIYRVINAYLKNEARFTTR